jgi:asparagine synthase (glutamine-hydrolysing)
MSAILGYINFDGRPVDKPILSAMQNAMPDWGPDGQSLWVEGCAGIGYLKRNNTDESLSEEFPLTDQNSGIVFFSYSRLDNRDELYQHLTIPYEQRNSITDAQLLFDAYRKWGNDCVNYLLGDWIFVAWHKNEKKLVIIRDHYGATGMYYFFNGQQFVFSSSIKGILASGFTFEPNMLRMAQIITGSNGDGHNTGFKNIKRLLPGHLLTVQLGDLNIYRYWKVEEIDQMPERSVNDIQDEFADIFEKAVTCRLRNEGTTGSFLSGGLDSGSVSAMAASLLKKQNKKLVSFTSVPLFNCDHLMSENRFADERLLAEKLVVKSGNIEHILIDAANYSPVETLKSGIAIHDEPIRNISNLYWIFAILEKASELGIKTLLSGQAGNASLSFPPLGFLNPYVREKSQKILSYKGIRNNIVKTFIPEKALNWYRSRNRIADQVNSSYISHSFANNVSVYDNLKQISSTYENYPRSFSSFLMMLRPEQNYYGCFSQQNTAAFGVQVLDPTTDRRLIEFSASLIKRSENEKSMYPRNLLQTCMKSMIPDEVLFNQKRGVQAGDLLFRTQNHINELEDLMGRLVLDTQCSSIIDIDKCSRLIKKIPGNEPELRMELIFLYRALAAAYFLQNFRA